MKKKFAAGVVVLFGMLVLASTLSANPSSPAKSPDGGPSLKAAFANGAAKQAKPTDPVPATAPQACSGDDTCAGETLPSVFQSATNQSSANDTVADGFHCCCGTVVCRPLGCGSYGCFTAYQCAHWRC
jgi:hypothetical protein